MEKESILYCKIFKSATYDDLKVYCEDKGFLDKLETCLHENSLSVAVIDRLERALAILKEEKGK